jgi:hypothetical protein
VRDRNRNGNEHGNPSSHISRLIDGCLLNLLKHGKEAIMKNLVVTWTALWGIVTASGAGPQSEAKKENAGQAVDGLKLSLSTDKTV